MRGSIGWLALGCVLALSMSGCCGGMNGGGCGCGYNACCDGGPVYGANRPVSRQGCGDECGTCRDGCDPCGNDCCQRNFCFHPFRWIGRLFWADTYCGSGCGGCGESCDSCNSCGGTPAAAGHYSNSTGGYSSGGYSTGRPGCKNCNRGQGAYDGEMSAPADGEVIEDNASPEPTPAPPPKTSRRTTRPAAAAYN